MSDLGEAQQDDDRQWGQVLLLHIREAFWARGMAALDSDVAHVAEVVEQHVAERLAARPSADTHGSYLALAATAQATVGVLTGHTTGCTCDTCDQLRYVRLPDVVGTLAARPSADPETLRQVRHLADELERGGLPVFAARFRTALDGTR